MKTDKYDSLSIIIPVFNSQSTLTELIEKLDRLLKAISFNYEIILVNDCSRDSSYQLIVELARRYKSVKGIDLMRNYGQHNAILCGIRAARNKIIVTLDDDLQNPPEEIPKLLERLSEGFDVVYGTPQNEQHGFWRDLASKITKIVLQNAMGADVARQISAFRAFKTELRDAFTNYRGLFVSIDVLLTWGTTRFSSVTVRHDRRTSGFSNYTVSKLINHALNMITGFSTLPLRIAGLIGFIFTLFGVCVLGYVIIRYLIQGSVVPGFPFLASIIAIFSGAQLFALGIIGEYLARMHYRSMDHPSYAIRSATFHVKEG